MAPRPCLWLAGGNSQAGAVSRCMLLTSVHGETGERSGDVADTGEERTVGRPSSANVWRLLNTGSHGVAEQEQRRAGQRTGSLHPPPQAPWGCDAQRWALVRPAAGLGEPGDSGVLLMPMEPGKPLVPSMVHFLPGK